MESRRQVANEYISKQHIKAKVLRFAGLSRSTYYHKSTPISHKKSGRPIPGYSVNNNGTLTPDSWIINQLKIYRADINFQNGIGCKALHEYLELEHQMTVNHKKIYRLCKENGLLLQRKKKIKKIKKMASNLKITEPNQLWQFDIKYGYIHGEDRPFYLLAFVDVFNKEVIGYHLGITCTAKDLQLTLKTALMGLSREEEEGLILRSDNGPQMSSNQFKYYIDSLSLTHEFTPVRCPDKNAFVESFFSIFEIEFLQVRYFPSLEDVHRQVRDWVNWYNQRRLHGSLKYKSPYMFKQRFIEGKINGYEVSA